MKKLATIVLAVLLSAVALQARSSSDIRLLYWNIQNGMWSDQGNNYDNFVAFVKSQDPDICVWCEAASIYYTGTADKLATNDEKYLPYNWDALAARYGHSYVYLGGWRDNYPQVVTSKYPIRNVKRILGSADDVVVTHGASWTQIDLDGRTLNLVTLHTWPQRYAYKAEDKQKSAAENGGDFYRRREMERICTETILTDPDAKNHYWMMMGDFNAVSRVDAENYDYAPDSPAYLVHDYIKSSTPYVDVIGKYHGKQFCATTGSGRRIDFIYASSLMNFCIRDARVYPTEGWLAQVRDPKGISNFWHPSDHRPIMVDFDISCTARPFDIAAEWHDLERGAQWTTVNTEIDGYMQHIAAVRYPARKFITEVANDSGLNPPMKKEYPAAVDPLKPATTTSEFGKRYNALAALNAGYFNVKTLYPQTYVVDNGQVEGHTTPDELPRVDGMVVFKKHKIDIFTCDTLGYEAASKGWPEAMACGPVLIEDGVVRGGWPETSFFMGRHPRTVIGYTRDGYIYFIDIDGRWHGKAEGASIAETAEVARAFGLYEAINLDGGGSSTVWTSATGVLNHPNDNHKWDNAGERVVPSVIIAR